MRPNSSTSSFWPHSAAALGIPLVNTDLRLAKAASRYFDVLTP